MDKLLFYIFYGWKCRVLPVPSWSNFCQARVSQHWLKQCILYQGTSLAFCIVFRHCYCPAYHHLVTYLYSMHVFNFKFKFSTKCMIPPDKVWNVSNEYPVCKVCRCLSDLIKPLNLNRLYTTLLRLPLSKNGEVPQNVGFLNSRS